MVVHPQIPLINGWLRFCHNRCHADMTSGLGPSLPLKVRDPLTLGVLVLYLDRALPSY